MSLFYVDSSCDLDPKYIKNLGIECFDLRYKIDDQEKTITEDFDYNKFYSKVRKGVRVEFLPLSVSEYIKVFEPAMKGGDDVLYVHASSQIFDTTNLVKAKQKLIEKYPERKFELIDSKNFSSGYGAVCFALAIMYKNGMSIEEIMKEDYKLIDSMACYMVVDSLESISNYGVIDTNAVIGTALNIKSIIAIDIDGKLKLIEKISGRKRAISKLVQLIRQTGQNIVDNPIFISNSLSAGDSEYLVGSLKEHFGDELRVVEHNITPSNTAVVGNGVVTISFRVHKKIH